MGRYKAYPEYKDSGVRRLGKVPIYWGTIKLKRLASIENGHDYKYVEAESGYPVIGSGGQFAWAKSYIYNEESVLLGRKGTINKPLYISAPFWVVDTMFYTKVVTNIRAKYIYYAALTIEFDLYSTNTALPSMTQEDLGNIYFAKPSIDEASKIEAFLDYETAKIDQLIAKQQRLIELLKEKRQAVISHAVTKGLNPDVKMKDSGVEWLGEVPEHWRVGKLSYYLKLKSGDSITSESIEEIGDYAVFGGNGKRGYAENYNCDGNYVLIGRQGALCGNINIASGKFYASEHAVVVYPLIPFDIRYLAEMLRFMNLGQYSVSAAQPGISVERINMLYMSIPPLNEQKKIGELIESTSEKYEKLLISSCSLITLLQERRSVLISAAVTGKIDVRDWQAPKEAT